MCKGGWGGSPDGARINSVTAKKPEIKKVSAEGKARLW